MRLITLTCSLIGASLLLTGMSGCKHIPISDIPWEAITNIVDDVTSEPESNPEPTVEEPDQPTEESPSDPNDWRTWEGAPTELVPGAPYGRDSYGNFRYRNATDQGKYKPQTTLWLLPQKNPTNGKWWQVEHIKNVGEYVDEQGLNPVGNWFRITGYHNNRVKCRFDKRPQSGNWIICKSIYDQIVFKMKLVDSRVRQE